MMNKYKKTFSQLYPSYETTERIINMSKNKKGKMKYKGIIIAVVAIVVIISCTIGANAATGGALLESAKKIANGAPIEEVVDYIKGSGDLDEDVILPDDENTKTEDETYEDEDFDMIAEIEESSISEDELI